MYHNAFACCFVALLCVSQTKAGANNEVRVANNRENQRDGAENQQRSSVHVTGSSNADAPDRKLSFETNKQILEDKKNLPQIRRGSEPTGQELKSFEMTTHGANSDKVFPKQENLSNRFNSGGTPVQFGGGTSYSNPVPMTGANGESSGKTGTQKGGSVPQPSMRHDDVKTQTSGTTGLYGFDSNMQRTPGSTQFSSVGIERNSQVAESGALNKNLDGMKYNSGSYVQNTRADFPSYTSAVSVTANSGGSVEGQANKLTTFNEVNSGGGVVLPSGSSFPKNSIGINTANSGGGGYVLSSESSIPQNKVGVSTTNIGGGGGFVLPSGSSVPQNSVGVNTAYGGGGFVLPSGSSIPQNTVRVQQSSQIPTGTLQTTRINAGIPVIANGGGSVYTPTYKPGGAVSISGGGSGGSYGQTNGGIIPGYNIGMQQGVRIPTIGISGTVRPVGGQINGRMLSGRSQAGVMFPAGAQQIKVGYGTSAATRQIRYVPQTQVRTVNQIPTIGRLSIPVRRVDPGYTSFSTSGRIPSMSTYSSIPSTGVRMTYGQNQVRSPSVLSGPQLRIPSTNIQYMSSAGIPTGAVQVSG